MSLIGPIGLISQVGDGGEETVGAVGFAVAPGCGVATLGDVGFGVEGTAGETVEDGEVVGARDDAAHGIAPVGQGVADDRALPVDGAVGGAAHQLGTAVTVEVVDHELGVVGAGADVFTKVDTPEECTIRCTI